MNLVYYFLVGRSKFFARILKRKKIVLCMVLSGMDHGLLLPCHYGYPFPHDNISVLKGIKAYALSLTL